MTILNTVASKSEFTSDDFIEACMYVELSFELITPEIAMQMLEHNTSNYRKLIEMAVARYVKDLNSLLWTHTTATIAFTVSGVLVDGQHRLHAIARSGKSVWMFVMRNLPEEFTNDPNQDKGKMRSVGVYINKLGVKNSITSASALRQLHRLAISATLIRGGYNHLTDSQVLKCITYMPDSFFEWVDTTCSSKVCKKIYSATMIAVFFYLASSHDREAAQEFFDVFTRRIDASSSHPANTLREQVTGNRKLVDNEKFINLAFAAFANALRGQNRKVIRPFGELYLPDGSKKALNNLLEILRAN